MIATFNPTKCMSLYYIDLVLPKSDFRFIHGGIQGGFGGPQNKDSDEVYVLSLPAFRWFRANYTSVSPRAGHTCHPAGNNQLILIGGSNPTQFVTNTMEAWNGTADPWPQGIGVFDMNALAWKDSYQSHAAKYTPADVIKQHYNLRYVRCSFDGYWAYKSV